MSATIKVLMVCLGNICRSPTAEAVFRAQVTAAGLHELIHVDSAGTSNWHIGEAPDPRSIRHAAARHFDLSSLRARQVQAADFTGFDYIIAMDSQNLRDLQLYCPPQHHSKLALFLPYGSSKRLDVPDPYEHGPQQFDEVLDLVEDASAGLLAYLREQHTQLRKDK